VLETNRLKFSEFTPSDWEEIKALLSNPEVIRYLHFAHWTETQLRAWFDRCIENSAQSTHAAYDFAIHLKDSHSIIGWFGIRKPDKPTTDKERAFTCALHRRYWGNGYMTEALQAIFAYEFTLNGICQITGTCEPENISSAKMMEKVGMTNEGIIFATDPAGKSANRLKYVVHQDEYFATDKKDWPSDFEPK